MEIRLTRDEDIPQLKKMWRAVFDSNGTFTELFFKYRYKTCEGIGMFDKGELLSMLYLLPCTLKMKDKEYSMSYIFAVATFPDKRGKGYCSETMRFAHEYLREKGIDCASLVPAEGSLFDFYAALDYKKAFYIDLDTYHVLNSRKLPAKTVSLSSQRILREEYMSSSDGFLSWDEDALSFCQKDNNYGGSGEIISFPSLGRNYAVCSVGENHVLIKEIACDKNKTRLINAVGNHYGKKKVIVRDVPTDKSHPFGMVYPVSDRFKEEFNMDSICHISLPMD